MKAHWVKFNGRGAGCVEAESPEEAMKIGSEITGKEAVSAVVLPYPADPRINQHVFEPHGVTPSFCYKPEQCKGHTCCPQNYSCTE